MKLFRYGKAGHEKPGVVWNGQHCSIAHAFADFNEEFFAREGLNELASWLKDNGSSLTPLEDGFRFGPPVARPSKLLCIGLNYEDHARETGAAIPAEPVLFMKSTTAIIGPYDDVMLPKGSVKSDWEVELAVVMGKRARYVTEEDAMDHVAGYCLHNDLSEREYQLERGGTWDKGKGCDTFAPLGPYLVTPDEAGDVHHLPLWLKLNGQFMQRGNTSSFIFNIPQVISYVSRFMTLLPGDIISTGTPPGVGLGMNPPLYLKEGDVMELGIDGLGTSRQQVVAFSL
ncbi:MAG TPA: fumarylacetoacetate hydrolase family protein [Phnomibacter sp.]|nr:fumarylacetoacetate hydrolase family protein [Phnomibacter sp.]